MISVCMATYNGERYIEKQLASIIKNLSLEDEIIVSDDGSSDHTLDIINSYKEEFPNIKIIKGPQKSVQQNFDNTIRYACGDIIFLSDQDDIWMDNKVEIVSKCFQNSNINVVLHDAVMIDGNGNEMYPSFYAYRKSKKGFIANIIRNSYLGCCMAFRNTLKEKILPIPECVEMHDTWIGLIGEWTHSSVFIDDKLICYRRHQNNVSSLHHYPLKKMIQKRLVFLNEIFKRMR